jgi:hypothetical protein
MYLSLDAQTVGLLFGGQTILLETAQAANLGVAKLQFLGDVKGLLQWRSLLMNPYLLLLSDLL